MSERKRLVQVGLMRIQEEKIFGRYFVLQRMRTGKGYVLQNKHDDDKKGAPFVTLDTNVDIVAASLRAVPGAEQLEGGIPLQRTVLRILLEEFGANIVGGEWWSSIKAVQLLATTTNGHSDIAKAEIGRGSGLVSLATPSDAEISPVDLVQLLAAAKRFLDLSEKLAVNVNNQQLLTVDVAMLADWSRLQDFLCATVPEFVAAVGLRVKTKSEQSAARAVVRALARQVLVDGGWGISIGFKD